MLDHIRSDRRPDSEVRSIFGAGFRTSESKTAKPRWELAQQFCLGDQPQQPLSEPPTMSVRLTEPPSDVGTGGGQIGPDEERLEAAAVDAADCVEVLGASPGSC